MIRPLAAPLPTSCAAFAQAQFAAPDDGYGMRRILTTLLLALSFATASAAEPARVVVVGTYHFSNPGRDMANVQAVDVTTPERQAELQAITDRLAKFEPDVVAVEWPADVTEERYRQYLDGSLPVSRNEVVQLGFRLAKQRGLERVYGIDVDGDFPFEPVQAWAKAHGRAAELDAALAGVHSITARITALQAAHAIGEVLHEMNTPHAIDEGQGFYMNLLRYGDGKDQPGVALNAAWQARNFGICARLLQALEPGDRAVVFYGQGHVASLLRCLHDTPGIEVEAANDYLPAPLPKQPKAA